MSILLIVVITYCLHLLLKLNWIMTGLLLGFLLIMLHFHQKYISAGRKQRERFEEAALYMETILYAFLKEEKVYQAFENTYSSLEEGALKRSVGEAVDYMRLTFDQEEVLKEGMDKVYNLYPCERIASIHQFMLHVEYYGGDIRQSIELLAEDKNRWSMRINQTIAERRKMFKEILLSVLVSLVICGVILYLPVMNVDISSSWLVQILGFMVVAVDDLIILKAQKYLCVDYLTIDELDDGKYYADKLRDFENYDYSKARRSSLIISILPLGGIIIGLIIANEPVIALSALVLLLFLNQHTIGRALARKRLTSYIRSAFPKWLLDIALLLQSENVYVALVRSRESVPKVLEDNLNRLIGQIELNPESSEPFYNFLKEFNLPEIHAALAVLYGLSAGSSANTDKQMGELISRNLELLHISDTSRLKVKTGNMYALFLAPVLTASMKLVVDMGVFLLSFLNMSVV